MTKIDTSTEAVEALILNSLKFSNLAAGEGFVLFGVSPEDFLFAYSKATGFEDWDNIGQHIITFMRAERDALEAENERLKAQVDTTWNEAIEAAADACNKEHLEDPVLGDEGDIAYTTAVSDCIFAIRNLKRPVKGESHE